MPIEYNVYCDESCHLERDEQPAMALGSVWCPKDKAREIAVRLREIKAAHGMSPRAEVKWGKVSPGGSALYSSLVDYFFDDDDLHFRALVVPDKTLLDHRRFNQTHDEWFFRMYYNLLTVLLKPDASFFIYLDVKDTRSAERIEKLHDVLANSVYDFDRSIIRRVQAIRSHESELLQLTDLLLGAVSYANRGGLKSPAKAALVQRIRDRSGYALTRSTLLGEDKFNVFVWKLASMP